MGRQSKEHREVRRGKTLNESSTFNDDDPKQSQRIAKLKENLSALAGGDAVFGVSPDFPADVWESSLEDILEFESVGSGISLFEGLQLHGMDLPSPERLDEMQSARKVMEVLHALEDLRVFLIGFDEMTACELYSTLWNQTLWEGCYVRKRHPGAITLIDVSHKMQRSDMLRFLEGLSKTGSIH
jgi:hypothetical protein